MRETVYKADGSKAMGDLPLVVLANPYSASASEIVTGALSDNDRALFVGERTFGKGSVQQVKLLEDGQGALKITNAYYYLPNGRNIHRRTHKDNWGVDPSEGAYVPLTFEQRKEMADVRRELANGEGPTTEHVTPEWIENDFKDPQLAAALTALMGKLDTGDWPVVGQSGAEALAKSAERDNLNLQREALEEALAEVDEKINALDLPAVEGVEGTIVTPDAGAQLEADADDGQLTRRRTRWTRARRPPKKSRRSTATRRSHPTDRTLRPGRTRSSISRKRKPEKLREGTPELAEPAAEPVPAP